MNVPERVLALGLLLTLPVVSAHARAAGSPEAAPSAAPAAKSPTAAAAKAKSPAATTNNGHQSAPPSDGPGAPAAAPPAGHPGVAGAVPQADLSDPSPELEPGTISATIVDQRGFPLGGQQVRLGILFQKVAEGESRSEKFARADAEGKVTFTGLTRGSDHAYRVTVQVGTASYQTSPFNLKPEMGQRVVLHVFPSTSEIEQAQIGMRGYTYIETRDDVFQFEALFRVFNVGQVTWVPKDVVVQLPKGFKAFKAQEGMTDVRFEAVDGVGARLKGTFPPGQSEASFRFQMPKTSDETAVFRMTLPPHVAEMRVIAEASSTMNLEVEGFQPPVAAANQNGQRVLVSVKQLLSREEQLKEFTATLSGIPTPGPGRWFAVLLAGGMAILGVLAARGAFDDASLGNDVIADKKRARELLLGELVALEAARRAERIGPRSYEQSRVALIDAVARLGLQTSRQATPGARDATSARRKRTKTASERA